MQGNIKSAIKKYYFSGNLFLRWMFYEDFTSSRNRNSGISRGGSAHYVSFQSDDCPSDFSLLNNGKLLPLASSLIDLSVKKHLLRIAVDVGNKDEGVQRKNPARG